MSNLEPDIYKAILEAETESQTRIEQIRSSISVKTNSIKKWAARGGGDPVQIEAEKALWKKFNRIAMNQKNISLELIDKLKVPYDCLFILGKKGIGKTWMLKDLFKRADDNDESIIYGRNRLIEIKQNLIPTFEDKSWIFKSKGTNIPIRLFSRKYFDEGGKPLSRGYLLALKSTDAGFGQDYPKVKHIIFDEVLAHRASVVQQADMDRFTKFLNSVVRKKKGVKAYFFGNLLPNSDQSVNSVFLNHFGLNWKDNLKYLKVPNPADPKKPLRLLFINTRNLFEGIDDDACLSHLTTNYDYKSTLASNTIAPICPKVLDDVTYSFYDTWFSIIISYKNVFTAVEIRHFNNVEQIYRGATPIEINKWHYACAVVPFNPIRHNKAAFSNLVTLVGSFNGIIKYRSIDELAELWDKIKTMSLSGLLMYGNEEAYKTLDEIIKKNYKDEGLFTSL